VNLENVGNAPLLLNVPSSGANPSVPEGYTINSSYSSSCPVVSSTASSAGQVLPAWNCYWAISFTPTENTPPTASMVVTDNNLNAQTTAAGTQTISLTGAAAGAATVTLSASATTVTDAQTLTVSVHVAGSESAVPTGLVSVNSTPGYGVVGAGGLAGTVPLDSNGNATISGTMGNTGTYTLSAYYFGDSNYAGAASTTTIPITVTQSAPASITPYYGQSTVETYGSVHQTALCVLVVDGAGQRMSKTLVTFASTQLTIPFSGDALTSDGVACVEATPPNAVGTYTATASVAGLATTVPFTVQVTGATLTITMKSPVPSRLYGSPNPVFTYTETGLVSGDNVTITPTTTATLTSPVGYYPVSATVSGPDAAKYAVIVIPATIYVHPAQLTIAATTYTSVYGQTPPQPTAYTITGFVNGETTAIVTGSPILTMPVTATSPVGSYLIHIDVNTLSAPNYGFARDPWHGRVNVLPAWLEATANSFTIKRGDPIPPLTYTLTGFVNGQTQATAATGTANVLTLATSNSRPGTYTIYMNLGTLAAANYRIHQTNGVLTITP
jgi:hypothetical protein